MQQKDNLVIDTRLGANNILAIIPYGGRNSKNTAVAPMTTFGRKLVEHLHCFIVINSKYRPSLVDMNDVRAIRKRKKVTDGFLVRIREFKEGERVVLDIQPESGMPHPRFLGREAVVVEKRGKGYVVELIGEGKRFTSSSV